MMIPRRWRYTTEHGHLLAVCPDCGGRMPMSRFWEHNPFKMCPYCTTMRELKEGSFKRMRDKVYGKNQ